MATSCDLASRKTTRAFRAGEHVLILAEGELPTPGFDVDIRQNPRRITPPQFDLVRCAKAGLFPQVITPYRHIETVRFPAGQNEITVHHADGTDKVTIEDCGDSLAGYREAVQGRPDHVPAPDAEEAVGFSGALSFDEAFANALANLPPSTLPFADALARVQVVETGGLFGGFPGFHHLFVRVSRTII
jgi:hypothetical protein